LITDLVKISKLKRVDGKVQMKENFDYQGDPLPATAVTEDVVCQVLHWGKFAEQDAEGRWYYTDCVWLRRMDDGTVEFANPGEIQYLDILNAKGKETEK
jgi:hypothetical protein